MREFTAMGYAEQAAPFGNVASLLRRVVQAYVAGYVSPLAGRAEFDRLVAAVGPSVVVDGQVMEWAFLPSVDPWCARVYLRFPGCRAGQRT